MSQEPTLPTSPTQPPTFAQEHPFLSAVPEAGIGVAKSAASSLAGLASLGEKLITRPIDVGMSKLTGKPPILPVTGPTTGEQIQQSLALQETGPAQAVGKGLEQIGELIAPIGLEEAGVNLASRIAPKVPKLAQGALKLAGKALGGATEFGVKSALQTGGNVQQTEQAAELGALFPPAEVALGGLGKLAGKVGTELFGKITGAGEAALREAYNNPNVMKFARQGNKESLAQQALDEAKIGLNKIKQLRGRAYSAALRKIKSTKQMIDPIVSGARDKARQLMDKMDIKIKPGKLLNNLDFGVSVIEKGQGSVQKAFNDVMKWTDNTPAGLDTLKKKLSFYLDELRDAPGAYQFVKGLRDEVRSGLEKNVPGYKAMTAGYHQASNLIEDLQKTLSLGDKTSRDAGLRKIMSAIRQDNGLRQDMLRTLGSAGGKDVIGKVAGAQLSPLSARGFAGTLEGPVSIIAALNPTHIPAVIAYLAASSPRLVGEAISLLGRTKGRILTPVVKKGLEALILQASRPSPDSSASTQTELRPPTNQ